MSGETVRKISASAFRQVTNIGASAVGISALIALLVPLAFRAVGLIEWAQGLSSQSARLAAVILERCGAVIDAYIRSKVGN